MPDPAIKAGRESLVEVKNLTKYFPITKGILSRVVGRVHAVDGVSFNILPGETFGLVGESGCGKTTTGRLILRLIEPTSGDIVFDGRKINDIKSEELRCLRREMQIVFQDPMASLNPRMTVGDLIKEPLEVHRVGGGANLDDQISDLLVAVGLRPNHMYCFPRELSGGQRQRVGMARALSLRPKLIVADEPVSALDVSIRSQIINLLKDLQEEFKLTYLFIAHDMSVVKHISDRVGVMYLGKMVEMAPKGLLFAGPQHPYTQALLSAIPIPSPGAKKDRIILEGDVPNPIDPPPGCRFNTRCRYVMDRCRQEEPILREKEASHWVACHLD
ncbi:MAG: peptide ABC transporter substrate-binding protein [Peptococcaceae bacterium BICA1-7]|nr:MAG: peptide ABC transporter substrate-binding protein [Peptococcaceae bacterium BICA1-7]HBV95484.1 ABC transporter ATP-binding protein [Desulfotomaculum sp.]